MKPISRINEICKFIAKRFAVAVIKYIFGIPEPGKIFDGKIESIIVIGQERFGDLIVLTPLIRKLRQTFPKADITLLGVSRMVSFLKNDPNLTRVVNIKRAESSERKKVLRECYDLLFSTKDHPSFTFLLLTARIKARYKVGIYHRVHKGYFNYMHFFEDTLPTVEKNMAPLHFMGIPFAQSELRPYLPVAAPSGDMHNFVTGFAGVRPVGINLSASNPGKEWPLAYWQKVLSEITGPVVILAMPDDADKKELLERMFNQIKPSPPTETLLDAGYLISRLRLLITTDTALVHVAACYNIPVLVLYRLERDMKKFPPLSDRYRIHISPTTNLADISPEQVITSMHDMLNEI